MYNYLFVCLYQIDVKTAKPNWPKEMVGLVEIEKLCWNKYEKKSIAICTKKNLQLRNQHWNAKIVIYKGF